MSLMVFNDKIPQLRLSFEQDFLKNGKGTLRPRLDLGLPDFPRLDVPCCWGGGYLVRLMRSRAYIIYVHIHTHHMHIL